MEDGALNVIISVSPHGPHTVRDWTTMMIMIKFGGARLSM
jgi:hypothetical protein